MNSPDWVEDRLRVALRERAASVQVTATNGERLGRTIRANRRRTRHQLLTAVAAVAAFVVVAAAMVVPPMMHRAEPPAQHAAGQGDVVGTATLVSDDTAVLAVVADSVWVANPQGNWNLVLQRLDGTTLGQSQPAIPVGDPGTYPGGMAVNGPDLWVTTADGYVRRFDTRTGQVTLTVRTPGVQPGGVAIADGFAWVASTSSSAVLRIDPNSGTVTTVPVGPPASTGTRPIAAAPAGLWVANGDGSLSLIDPATSREALRVREPHCCGSAIVLDPAGGLWITDPNGANVTHVAGTDGQWISTVPVDANPSGLSVYSGAVWVACRGISDLTATRTDGVLDRIDYRTSEIVHRVRLGGSAEAIVTAGIGLVVSDPTTSRLVVVRADR